MHAASGEVGRLAIVGDGRLGKALAQAFRDRGLKILGPLGRGNDGAEADAVLLCVPDAAIADAAGKIAPGRVVGHCSGATPLDLLHPHEAFSLHPLMTVTKRGATFDGAGCAVAGSTERSKAIAVSLATRIGMHPIEIADDDRPLYHAAASIASNFVVTLAGVAEALGERVGMPRALIAPLTRAAVEQWAEHGAQRALTGPVARGDDDTVARQRAAIAARALDALELWDAMVARTRSLASTGSAIALEEDLRP